MPLTIINGDFIMAEITIITYRNLLKKLDCEMRILNTLLSEALSVVAALKETSTALSEAHKNLTTL